MYNHVTVELIFGKDEHETFTIQFEPTTSKVIYLFENVAKFQKRPYLVTFNETFSPSEAFIPGLMRLDFENEMLQISQNGTVIFPKAPFDDETPITFYVHEELRYPLILNSPVTYQRDLCPVGAIGIYLEYQESTVRNKYFRSCLEKWKAKISENGGDLYYINPENGNAEAVYLNSFEKDGETVTISDHKFFIKETMTEIIIRPFMAFMVSNANFRKETFKNMTRISLGPSFAHHLTRIGFDTANRLKKSLLKRFELWKPASSTLLAPISSICQYSGSGKSRISTEMTKIGPGLSIVLRDIIDGCLEDAFPPRNNLSEMLTNLIGNSPVDEPTDLANLPIKAGTVTANVLDFIASVICTYLQEVVDHALKSMESDKISPKEALKQAYRSAGPRIPLDEAYDDSISYDLKFNSTKKMFDHMYTKLSKIPKEKLSHLSESEVSALKNLSFADLTVNHVALFIDLLLQHPGEFLLALKINDKLKDDFFAKMFPTICREIQLQLTKCPFVFVLDEAHKLAECKRKIPTTSITVTGFQLFRRALSYLNCGTRIYVLTLGTKSVILDMNPPLVDSLRLERRTCWAPPIVLSGNFDIHKHECGLSYYEFVPTYQNLKNPLLFKLLASQGSSIWSSIPFSGIVNLAATKLRNSSRANHEDAFVSWMIRTGIFANPKSADVEALVAHRMADLFNLKDDLKSVSVFYPSQPIMGIAARMICHDTKFQAPNNLFRSLLSNSSLLTTDRGELAESIAFMTTMLAVDKSENVSDQLNTFQDYVRCFVKIIAECPKLHNLWRKKSYILEPESEVLHVVNDQDFKSKPKAEQIEYLIKTISASNSIESLSYEDIAFIHDNFQKEDYDRISGSTPDFCNTKSSYHVTTVSQFLIKLYGPSFQPYLMLYPQSTLDGLVNASHFVKLPSTSRLEKKKKYALHLPLPNELVTDTQRNIIDKALLRLGLIKQCGFSMPPNYFGIDAIIPVCLDQRNAKGEPCYTFIAIQVKASEHANLQHVTKMQARLHFVNCPQAKKHPSNAPVDDCPHCCSDSELSEIYRNQIGLIVSFGNEYINSSSESTLSLFSAAKKIAASTAASTTTATTTAAAELPQETKESILKQLFHHQPTEASNRFDEFQSSPFKFSEVKVNFKGQGGSTSIMTPQVTHEVDVNRRLRMFSCAWNEEIWVKERLYPGMDPSQADPTVEEIQIALKPDSCDDDDDDDSLSERDHESERSSKRSRQKKSKRPFIPHPGDQRIFCVASHGFEAFKHLFYNCDSEIVIAKNLLNPEWVIGDESTVDIENMVAALLHESLVPEYNEYLMNMRREKALSLEEYELLVDKLCEKASENILHK